MKSLQIGIVGAGVFGLANAWAAAKRGHKVTVFERDPQAVGASVRNFGMVWPVGQQAGEVYRLALKSRSLWLELCREADLWISTCGSIHLAHREDELAVLEEFCALGQELRGDCRLLSTNEVLALTHAANPDGLLGGMFSSTECCVNPRQIIERLPDWLRERFGVEFHFGVPVARVAAEENHAVVCTNSGHHHRFDRVVVCGGADVGLLFPQSINAQAKRCKLQMMKSVRQENHWHVGPHLAGGLTLRHYRNFEVCPSLAALKHRIATETPELDHYGIHVMISQNNEGEVIMGDSHEYGDQITPFDKPTIDELILRELRKIVRLPDWTIGERWHGIYVKHPAQPASVSQPQPNTWVFAATGGTGMTLSQGLAEQFWETTTL